MADKREMYLKQWAQDLADQKASGLTQKEWCVQKGISMNTFKYRIMKVRRASEEAGSKYTGIVPAEKPEEPASESQPFFARVNLSAAPETFSGISICCNDTRVNIAPDASDTHVRMILEVLSHA